MDPKEEIVIINEKIEAAKKAIKEDSDKKEKILKLLASNQNKFYHWQQLEKNMNSFLRKDEEVFQYIQKNFGEGMLMAVLKRYIPDLKNSLSETIDKQLTDLTITQWKNH